MPQADIRYSADLILDLPHLFDVVETTILVHDAGSGNTKCRAYPSAQSNHTHMHITVALLDKPHRDAAFMHPAASCGWWYQKTL